MYKIEEAMALEPELLNQDWTAVINRLPLRVRSQLRAAKAITFIGTGSSYHVALWAQWLCQFSTSGKVKARAISTWDYLAETARSKATPTKKEFFVAISHRGNSGLTKLALQAIGKRPHVLISAQGTPTGSHASIYTSPQETSNAHSMSLVGAMAAASELIAVTLTTAGARKLRTERAMAAGLLAHAGRESTDWHSVLDAIPAGPRPTFHFIGGGSQYPIALELTLKVQEIIHCPAHAYNTEQFLHGPIAAVEDHDIAVFLPTATTAKRAKEKFLYDDRLKRGVLASEAVGALTLSPAWPDEIALPLALLSAPWQALPQLYWGQWLCVALAKKWGLDPDTNRREDPRYEEARRQIEA